MVRGVGLAVDDHILDPTGEILRHENKIAGEGRPRPLQLVVHADRGRVRFSRMAQLPRVAVGGNAGRERRLQASMQCIVRREIEIRSENA